MKLEEIDRILLLVRSHGILHSKATKEIYKLHLEGIVNIMEEMLNDSDLLCDSVIYTDMLDQIKQELKTLEGE